MIKLFLLFLLLFLSAANASSWYSKSCINEALKSFDVEENIDDLPSLEKLLQSYKPSVRAHLDRHEEIVEDFEYVKNELKENNLPVSIAFVCFAESNFQRKARGYNTAGIWQLTNSSARILGLKVTRKVDERLDVKKSTKAIIKLWKRLMKKYDKLYLADFAYGLGEGSLDRLISSKDAQDFGKLWKSGKLKHGTKAHFAKVILLHCAFSTKN